MEFIGLRKFAGCPSIEIDPYLTISSRVLVLQRMGAQSGRDSEKSVFLVPETYNPTEQCAQLPGVHFWSVQEIKKSAILLTVGGSRRR